MFLWENRCWVERLSFPRVCGDVSGAERYHLAGNGLSPRMRGCFRVSDQVRYPDRAFPAYAGMFPAHGSHYVECGSFPRVCGDVSSQPRIGITSVKLSPRMRGCFYIREMRIARDAVFPAYAGMFLGFIVRAPCRRSSPRVCGDISTP